MHKIATAARASAIGVVVAGAVLVAGCVQSTGGTAVRAQGGKGPLPTNVPPLSKPALDKLLLSARDINSITGGTDMRITTSAEDMSDHSDPSADKAKKFFDTSHDEWQRCANSSVAVDSTDHTRTYIWNFEKVQKADESIITQYSSQEESNGWACQHAMGLVSNVIAESFACGFNVSDEAEQIVTKIMDNAATHT